MAHTFERPELAEINEKGADQLPLLADWSQKIVHQTQAASGDMQNRGILPNLAIGEENRPVTLALNDDYANQINRYRAGQEGQTQGFTPAPRYGQTPDSQGLRYQIPTDQATDGGHHPQAPIEHGLQAPPDNMHRRIKR